MAIELGKKNILMISVVVIALIFIARLFYLQIVDEEYKVTAANNALRYETSYPARGLILDRNGNILVGNETAYDIVITPYEVVAFDTLALCSILNDLNIESVRISLQEYKKNRRRVGYQSFTFVKQISNREYADFIEQAYKFPGFKAQARVIRNYPYSAGANLYGYISEADSAYLEKNPSYKRGDYVGRTGIEEAYETILRGEKGYNIFLRDVHNKVHSVYSNGDHDKEAIPGKNIISTIDGELQQYGELLMKNKIGSVVAIEPSSGEILAMVSSPGMDISMLTSMSRYYSQLVNDPHKPMFNRAVMSPYPPGSVFKIVNALIGLEQGVVNPETRYSCNNGYHSGSLHVGCHVHRSPLNMEESIMMSCNAYYCNVFRNIIDNPNYPGAASGFSKWREFVSSFGFGSKLGSDFPSEQGGMLPTAEYYDRFYGKNRWGSSTILSLAIGQGEIGTTPLHLANLAAIIANRGHYYTPHLIKESPDTLINNNYSRKHYTMVDTTRFSVAIEGMYRAVNSPGGSGATAWRVAAPGLDICGKTGTAQNPHGKDHSVFICFAPKDNPKIAIAAYIENAGAGATWAAPIASLLAEKYLSSEVARISLEDYIINSTLIQLQPNLLSVR